MSRLHVADEESFLQEISNVSIHDSSSQ